MNSYSNDQDRDKFLDDFVTTEPQWRPVAADRVRWWLVGLGLVGWTALAYWVGYATGAGWGVA
jgi:hypothetical protein